MRAVTIKEAKAHLNELIDAAAAGEQVVLLRGSRHVAAIIPITQEQLELVAELTDAQAGRFWARLDAERKRGALRTFRSAEAAVAHLGKPSRKRAR
jgi:prevent-host-death family protein